MTFILKKLDINNTDTLRAIFRMP